MRALAIPLSRALQAGLVEPLAQRRLRSQFEQLFASIDVALDGARPWDPHVSDRASSGASRSAARSALASPTSTATGTATRSTS
jgi:hypothetical protein